METTHIVNESARVSVSIPHNGVQPTWYSEDELNDPTSVVVLKHPSDMSAPDEVKVPVIFFTKVFDGDVFPESFEVIEVGLTQYRFYDEFYIERGYLKPYTA